MTKKLGPEKRFLLGPPKQHPIDFAYFEGFVDFADRSEFFKFVETVIKESNEYYKELENRSILVESIRLKINADYEDVDANFVVTFREILDE